MTRKVGKYGLRPTPHGVKLGFKFGDYVDATKLPPIPSGDFGHTDLLTKPLGMYLNDELGDCVVAGSEHETRLWVAEGTGADSVTFSDACTVKNYELLGNYQPGNPDTDQGCDMVKAAQLRMRDGITDANGKTHKIGIALELEPGNIEQLWYAIYYFDGVGLGIAVTSAWEQDFADGIPWDAADYNPGDIVGGHYVPACARKDGNLVIVTWGALQQMTPAGYKVCNGQNGGPTFAYASQEKLKNGVDLEGLSWSQMRTDIQAVAHV